MRAGLMRNRVTVQESVTVTDTLGDPRELWDTKFTMWAQAPDPSATENPVGGTDEQVTRRTFVTRYRTDISHNDRLLWPTTSDIWDIQSVLDPDGRQRLTQIVAVWHG